MMDRLSIIIPAKNEAPNLDKLLPKIRELYPDTEVIVVNDGSSDHTSEVIKAHNVIEVYHPVSQGNGAAVKSGARAASGNILIFMDGDGQHDPSDINLLLEKLNEGYDMVVGARSSKDQASFGRRIANGFYNWIASHMVGQDVKDLTSGFRVARAKKFREFLYLLPNGFSYPTTSTMAFFRSGYPVGYLNIRVKKREGDSHIRPIKDGARFLLIIFKVGTLYSPLKIFFPMSLLVFFIGLSYYGYTYFSFGRFTNMSALMFTTALIIFLVGLVSEQITALLYQTTSKHEE